MRWILPSLLICLLCGAAWAAPPPASGSPPTRAARPLFKGYELYSYELPVGWRFVLMPGTNRNKRIDEVAAAPALTLVELKQRMAAMAVGETVSWSHVNVASYKGALRLARPDAAVIGDLQALAARLQIHLFVP